MPSQKSSRLSTSSAHQALRQGWEHARPPHAAWHEGSCLPLRANAALLACTSCAAMFPYFFFICFQPARWKRGCGVSHR